MQNRRSFFGFAAAAAGAFLSRDAGARDAGSGYRVPGFREEAMLAASGRLGRAPLIDVRATLSAGDSLGRDGSGMPGGPDGRAALDLGVRISQMVRGVASRPPVRIWTAGWPAGADSAEDSPGAVIVRYDFGDMLLNFELRGQPMGTAGAGFRAVCYGTEGTLIMDAGGWSVHWNDGRTGAADDAGRAREAAWRVCDADAATGRLSAALWRAAGISYRLGRDVRFDPSTESCPDDPAANELLSAGHRRRYCFPEA